MAIYVEPGWNLKKLEKVKTNRFILKIGDKAIHLSRKEVDYLVDSCECTLDEDYRREDKMRALTKKLKAKKKKRGIK